ncbi:hypothetical protein [Oceanospirillum sediminis]|uniref:Uncharacterized protein n=1 Tax=Oceanospirillum sediminis TaxID=2760088 RepID=A0A839IVS1_9GAMM|nr:hypothetical protein [Oceanospirillum sediminis]MBB1489071.1 hypothetical protein [Oceanospirillum sediminis]
MDFQFIDAFLDNTFIKLLGYVISLIAGVIAIWQSIRVNKIKKELIFFKQDFNQINQDFKRIKIHFDERNVSNEVKLGERSQYIQDANGPISIDNRNIQ